MERSIYSCLLVFILSIGTASSQVSGFTDIVRVDSDGAHKNMSLDEIVSKYDNGRTIIKLEGKEYKSPQIRVKKGVKLIGEQGTKISPRDGKVMNALILAGGHIEIDKISLDGGNKVFWGIFSTSSVKITNSIVQNFYGNKLAPGNGIRHLPTNLNSQLIVSNTIIRNINSFEDGKVGNYVGATRGVLSSGGDVKIANTSFSNIQGTEDADCIHIQTKASKGLLVWASAGNVVIENCTFSDFGKRAIKIQGSGVSVINNQIKSDAANNYSAISIYGSNNLIKGNHLELVSATAGITVNSGNRNRIMNNEIIINREQGKRTLWGITLDNSSSETVIQRNKFVTNGKRFPVYMSKSSLDVAKERFQGQNTVEVR